MPKSLAETWLVFVGSCLIALAGFGILRWWHEQPRTFYPMAAITGVAIITILALRKV